MRCGDEQTYLRTMREEVESFKMRSAIQIYEIKTDMNDGHVPAISKMA